MRRAVCSLLALPAGLFWGPGRAAAQTGPQPRLVLSLAAGAVDGSTLWQIPDQPFCPVYTGGTCAAPADSLRLAREHGSSITLGAAVSYFPSPHFGIQGELAYLGWPLRDACATLNASPSQQSRQLCANTQGASHSTGAILLLAGAALRAAPRRQLSPYLRGGVGLVAFDHSTIELSSADSAGNAYQILADDSPRRLALSFVAGGGLTVALGRAYQFRVEARDVVTGFERVTGASDASLVPPARTRFFHRFALTLGLDVVLEQKRGRRY
jgi:hypothetical protein